MNSKIKLVITSVIAGVLVAPVAFAEATPKEIYNQCQSNAGDEMIPLGETQKYIRKCMEDAGIEAADVDSTMQEMMPAPGNTDDSTPAVEEDRT